MTKKQMIQDIQVAEARAWKHYRDMDAMAGRDTASIDMVTRSRVQWATLYDLREAMGIPSLPFSEMVALDLVPFRNKVAA